MEMNILKKDIKRNLNLTYHIKCNTSGNFFKNKNK